MSLRYFTNRYEVATDRPEAPSDMTKLAVACSPTSTNPITLGNRCSGRS